MPSKKTIPSGEQLALVGRDSAHVLLLRVFSMLANIAIYALLARQLDQHEFGLFVLGMSLITGMATAIPMGLSEAALRLVATNIAKDRNELAAGVARASTKYVAIIGLVIGVMWLGFGNDFVALAIINSPQLQKLGPIFVVCFVSFALQKHLAESLRGAKRQVLASLFAGPLNNFLLVSLVLFAYFNYSSIHLESVLYFVLVAFCSSALLASLTFTRRFPATNVLHRTTLRDLWPIAWPIGIAATLVYLANQADLWIVGALINTQSVALYGAALKACILLLAPLQVINSVIQPLIVEHLVKKQKVDLEELLGVTATIAALPTLFLMTIYVVFGHTILGGLFGSEYEAAFGILVVLGIARTINALTGSCGQCLILGGYQKTMLWTTTACLALGAIGAIVLGASFGAIGVAIGFGSGMALQNLLQWRLVKHLFGIGTHFRIRLVSRAIRYSAQAARA